MHPGDRAGDLSRHRNRDSMGIRFSSPRSSAQYAADRGAACPSCGSGELDRAPACEAGSGEMTAWVGCERCRHTWLERYALIGYSELEPPAT